MLRRNSADDLVQIKMASRLLRLHDAWELEVTMRTTRDAIKKDWLHCPDANEVIDVRLSYPDCSKDHGCKDRLPSHCPLYVERLVKRTAELAA
jgi:hypothetical protein